MLESLFLKRFRTANDAGFGAKLDAMLNDCRTSERLNGEFAQLMPVRDPPTVPSSTYTKGGEEEESDTPATPAKKTVGGGGGASSAAEEEALAKAFRSVVADPSEVSSDPIASLAIIEAHCWPRAAASMAYVGSSFGYYDNNGHIKKNNKNNNNANSSRNTQQQWANGGDDGDEALSSEAAATALALRRLPAHVRKGTIPHQMHITVLTKGHWPLLSLGGGSGSGGFGGGGGNDSAGGGAECGGNVTGAGEKKKPSTSGGEGDSDGGSDGSSLHGFGGLSDGAPTAAPAALLRGLRLPSATVACMEVFRAFYHSKHRSRLLEFCLSQGSFDVLVRYTTSASSSSVSCSGNSSPNPQRQSPLSVDDNAAANGTHQSSSSPPSLQKRSILLNIPTFMAAPLLLFGPTAPPSASAKSPPAAVCHSQKRGVAALMRQTSVCTPILRIASSSSSAFCSSQVPSSASASSSPLTSTTLTADTVVTFNTNFKSKVRFVKVSSVSMRAPAAAAAESSSNTAADGANKDAIGGGGGTSATNAGGGEGGVSIDPALVASAARGAVRRERPLELSAQIMRFMKQSSGYGNGSNDPSSSKKAKAVAHGDLVKAVREALQHIFVPTPEEIKKGVEALIERDMLRRSDDLVGHYEYVA